MPESGDTRSGPFNISELNEIPSCSAAASQTILHLSALLGFLTVNIGMDGVF